MVDSIEFEPVYFAHPKSTHASSKPIITDCLQNTVAQEGKPAVAIVNGNHAVTLVREEKQDYVFKNSYGTNNPNNPPWIKIPKLRSPARHDFKFSYLTDNN